MTLCDGHPRGVDDIDGFDDEVGLDYDYDDDKFMNNSKTHLVGWKYSYMASRRETKTFDC